MENPNLPKLADIPLKWEKRFGKGVMVLPSANEVEAAMRNVRKGDVITVTELRESLARKYAVQTACPLVTGIFVRIAAEAAEEDAAAGKKKITPTGGCCRAIGRSIQNIPAESSGKRSGCATKATRSCTAKAVAGAWRSNPSQSACANPSRMRARSPLEPAQPVCA